MNKKHLYKALCLLSILTVHQANAALLINPVGPGYNVNDYGPGYAGITDIEVDILVNDIPIVLDFDPLGSTFEEFNLIFNNFSGNWTSFSIEYVISDPLAPVSLDLEVLAAGTSTPLITDVLTNPNTGLISGMKLEFMPSENSLLHIAGLGIRPIGTENLPYSLVITADTILPIPAAVWLFGSGLLGLIGVARRKKA